MKPILSNLTSFYCGGDPQPKFSNLTTAPYIIYIIQISLQEVARQGICKDMENKGAVTLRTILSVTTVGVFW